MKICRAWPADKTVRTGNSPPLKNSSLSSIFTLNKETKKEKDKKKIFLSSIFTLNKETEKEKDIKNENR